MNIGNQSDERTVSVRSSLSQTRQTPTLTSWLPSCRSPCKVQERLSSRSNSLDPLRARIGAVRRRGREEVVPHVQPYDFTVRETRKDSTDSVRRKPERGAPDRAGGGPTPNGRGVEAALCCARGRFVGVDDAYRVVHCRRVCGWPPPLHWDQRHCFTAGRRCRPPDVIGLDAVGRRAIQEL